MQTRFMCRKAFADKGAGELKQGFLFRRVGWRQATWRSTWNIIRTAEPMAIDRFETAILSTHV